MAIRFTEGGPQSYDPKSAPYGWTPPKKKKKSAAEAEPPKPKERTEAEVIEAQERGRDFVRAREKAAININPALVGGEKERQRLATQAVLAGGESGVSYEEQRRIEKATIEAGPVLGEAGAFEQVTPGQVPLLPGETLGAEVPVLGPSVSALGSVLGNALMKGWIPLLEPGEGAVTGEEAFDMPITPETLREAALREISIASYNEGISISESFGSFIEAIPAVGALSRTWVGGLLQAPSANADNVIAEIDKIKEAASTGQEKVRNGLEDPDYGLDRARSMEEDIARLEGRLKLLISTSAILRANSDEINRIEEGILEAKEKVARYRRASSFGYTATLTGTRAVPTDEQIYFELQRLKGGE